MAAVTREAVSAYIAENLDMWVRQIILPEIIRYCEAANLPRGFIDHIRIERRSGSSPSSYMVVNDWHRDSKYGRALLAVYFEYGTRDHWIAPRFARVLTWLHPGHQQEGGQKRAYGHAIYFQRHDTKKGDRLFSKGHYVTGLDKTMAMHNGYASGRRMLIRHIRDQVGRRFAS